MIQLKAAAALCAALVVGACTSTPSTTTPASGRGPDLSGEWVLTTNSQMGANDADMRITQTGKALSGTVSGRRGSVDLTGSVNGEVVSFGILLPMQGTELQIDYSGVVEGDTMSGTAVFGAFGEGTFTAKRKAR